jgi:hypothetical protein
VSSITIVNVMPQFGAYLMIVIYDCKNFIVQATDLTPYIVIIFEAVCLVACDPSMNEL